MTRTKLATLLAACLLASPVAAASGPGPLRLEPDQKSARILAAYGADPEGHRQALLELDHGSVDDLSVPVVLALADVHLRDGRFDRARDLCALVVQSEPGEPWTGWATLGKAWASIGLGDEDAAVRDLQGLAEGGSQSAILAAFMLAMLDAERGDFDAARYGFVRTSAAATTDGLRAAGRLGVVLVDYWTGEYDAAAAGARKFANDMPHSPLVDDARYVAARADLQGGRTEQAVAELRALARSRRRETEPIEPLVDLPPRDVFRAAFERYRRSRARLPDAQVAAALDADGGALARALLHRLDGEVDGAPEDTADAEVPVTARTPEGTPAAGVAAAHADRSGASPVDQPRDDGSSSLVPVATGLAVALGTGLVWWLTRGSRPSRRRAM
jgi:hypothetical protein